MKIIKDNIYDTIVIGAGIAGCSAAYFLQKRGQRVLLVDRSAVPASGGSGAAGAFISPKIGKGSTLQSLTNEAYEYAKDFYTHNFPEYFSQTGVIRIPKDEDDAAKFSEYEENNISKYQYISSEQLRTLGITNKHESFLFPEAGVCDAPAMCRAIWDRVEFRQFEVDEIIRQSSHWQLLTSESSLFTHNIVLATGYQNDLLDMRYMGVRGTWGSRGDYYSELDLKVSMHKKISVSVSIDGIIKLGATHVKAKDPCLVCDGKPLAQLEEQASGMVDTSDFVLKEIFCGMRAGSKDYFPLVGKVIDVPSMIEEYPAIFKGAKPPLKHIENLYIINGAGGRGFVFSPLMAEWLSELIVDGKEIDSRVNPDRLFLRWARRYKI